MISSGASMPPEVPEPSATSQTIRLDDEEQKRRAEHQVAVEERLDDVVARAERRAARTGRRCRRPPRRSPATTSSGPAGGGTRPRSGRAALVSTAGKQPGNDADAAQIATARCRRRSVPRRTGRAGRCRPAAVASRRRPARRATTGTKLRGFHSNSSSSTASSIAANGVPKIAVMPAAAPATSSVLRSAALRWKQLREQRADRAAGHDDRAFGAERAAAADRDRRGQRLQQRDLGRQPALAVEDRLDRFGNAVAADLVGAEPRHQPDDQPRRTPGS